MAENTVVTLTSEQLTALIETSIHHALELEAEHETSHVAKAIDTSKDVAKDHMSETIFELYKDHARELLLFFIGSLIDFISRNALVIGVVLCTVLITTLLFILSQKILREEKTEEKVS